MEITEIQITVPWGHVAGKTWGNKSNPLVLAFHGILDNAGTFDRLIPQLPPEFYYVCIDLPGHGRSSHFPDFFPAYTLNNVVVYKLIMNFFNRDKYVIMGHSYGAQIALLFAQLYPELVAKLIMLDSIHLFPVNVKRFRSYLREHLDFCIELDEKLRTKEAPNYTYNEALKKLQNQRMGFLSEEAAECLLQRNLTPSDESGKFKFSFDQRMKHFVNPIHDLRYVLETLTKFPVQCPVLMILGKDSEGQQIVLRSVLKLLQKNSNFLIKYVEGNHDVHNNSPENIAPYISKFLIRTRNKL